ncbi:MAG: hypothetical protein CMN22_05190 [Rubrivirga sp.]|nr:hypothetical protein [Rubrivirga sp.]
MVYSTPVAGQWSRSLSRTNHVERCQMAHLLMSRRQGEEAIEFLIDSMKESRSPVLEEAVRGQRPCSNLVLRLQMVLRHLVVQGLDADPPVARSGR